MEDLLDELSNAIKRGENQELEFIVDFPHNARELAKEIAAFATSNLGIIFLGISDNGGKKGVKKNGKSIQQLKDELQNRIAGIIRSTIRPSMNIIIDFIEENDLLYVKITVPKGTEPVYYVGNTPYIRILTSSSPATPEQVKELHRTYFQQWGSSEELNEQKQVFIDILAQLSDFELLWSDHNNRLINPDIQQLKYDIDSTGKSLIEYSLNKNLQGIDLSKELKEIGEMMEDLSRHKFSIDGGKSVSTFKDNGHQILEKVTQLMTRIKKRIDIDPEEVKKINDNFIKNIQETNIYWDKRYKFLENRELSSLKEHLRRLAYNFYRISNVPSQSSSLSYSVELKHVAIKIRELSSIKYFMMSRGYNPIKAIEKDMNRLIQTLNKIKNEIELDKK